MRQKSIRIIYLIVSSSQPQHGSIQSSTIISPKILFEIIQCGEPHVNVMLGTHQNQHLIMNMLGEV